MLVTSACGGDGASPETTQQRIGQHLPSLIDDSVDAFESVQSNPLLERATDGAERLSEAYHLGEDEDAGVMPFALRQATTAERPGEELARFLNEEIFIAANHEGGGVYRIPPRLFCEDELGGSDADCESEVALAQLKLRAEEAGDGVDITFLVGPVPAEPVWVELRSDSLAVATDFDQVRSAVLFLAATFAQDETVDLPDSWRGVVAATLTRHGDKDVSVALAVRETIEVAAATDEGDVSFELAASDPLVMARANGVAKTLQVVLDVGRLKAAAPLSAFADYGADQTVALDLGGLSGDITLSDADSFTFKNIGWGDTQSKLTLDGVPLLTLDVNADHGRRLDVTLRADGDNFPLVEVSPVLDVIFGAHLQALVDAGAQDIESFLSDETYRVTLDGTAATVQPVVDADTGAGAVAIRSGRLTLSSTEAAIDVVVDAGQCLVGVDEPASSSHPVLGHFASATCQ